MNDETFRVYHVQGGKEDVEYNNLVDHGKGMVTAMEYRHYGYHRTDFKTLEPQNFNENVLGSAYMAYSEQMNKWILYHQSQFVPNNPFSPFINRMIVEENNNKIVRKAEIGLPISIEVPKMAVRSAVAIMDRQIAAPLAIARSNRDNFVAEVHKEINTKKLNDPNSNRFNCI